MVSSGSEMERRTLQFFFDFASPYAYFAFDQVVAIAGEADLDLDLAPVLVWAVLKEQGIAAPLEVPARSAYLIEDMARSAEFHGVPYRRTEPLAISAHLAARMWLGLGGDASPASFDLARAIYHARFTQGRDIRERQVLCDIAGNQGVDADTAMSQIDAPANAEALRASVSHAVRLGAPGIPFLVIGNDRFFGADRLPQLRWRLGLAPAEASRVSS